MAGKYLDGDAVFPQCRRTYPGTAKDIEDLTLRINILESKLNEEFPMALACDRNRLDVIETGMAKDIGNLTLKVETLENADHYPSHRCETIETALKAQEDKFSAELSQLAKDTNRALCERKQINDTAREVSNEQAIAIYKMQEQVAGL